MEQPDPPDGWGSPMSEAPVLSAERHALRQALRELEAAALQGRNRTDAIAEANRRLAGVGLPRLSATRVGDWFSMGTPASDFTPLWTLVEVLLEWSGQPRAEALTGLARARSAGRWASTRQAWETRWEQARGGARPTRPGTTLDPVILGYLRAARNASVQHPYPDALDDTPPPSLAAVHVRQRALPRPADGSPWTDLSPLTTGVGAAVAAEEVFATGHGVCIVQAPAGGGKSTLLRMYRGGSVARWLDNGTGTHLPVLISARALSTQDPLPLALAKAATAELRNFGLLDELAADMFRHRPRPGACWLVLVDGLDELPDTHTRRTVLGMLADAAAMEPGLLRFVVATRPLPERDTEVMDPPARRYRLLPFSAEDLRTHATHWFHALQDPADHAAAFTAGLDSSGLHDMARTPLMASMLCRLYAADPTRPLPDGRSGAYQAFVELVFEQNSHKNIRHTHDQAIARITDRHQIPRDIRAAEQAAHQVRDNLPRLIDYLAHRRLNGDSRSTAVVLAAHLDLKRPPTVREPLWNSFLGDLLRPTGLLTEDAQEFDFLHRTLLEFHAARYATRSRQARTALLRGLLAPSQPLDDHPSLPDLEPSYLGFLLDNLLACPDATRAQVLQYLADLIAHAGEAAATLLIDQVRLRTGIPPDFAASHLTALANDTARDGIGRGTAAAALALVQGYRNAGADRLTALAQDTSILALERAEAAWKLTHVPGHRDDGAAELTRLVQDAALDTHARVKSAEALAWVDGHRDNGLNRLTELCQDTRLDSSRRVGAAWVLGGFRDGREDAIACLRTLARDATQHTPVRLDAARKLIGFTFGRSDGGDELVGMAQDPTMDGHDRVQAAVTLIDSGFFAHHGLNALILLAQDPLLDSRSRWEAAATLILVPGHHDKGAAELTHLTHDAGLDDFYRLQAATTLATSTGYRDQGAQQLVHLAEDSTLNGYHRVQACSFLAEVDHYHDRGTARLALLAQNTALDHHFRLMAVGTLTMVDGNQALVLLSEDTHLDENLRVEAARGLAAMAGYRDQASAQLTRLTRDTTLTGSARLRLARELADLPGHRNEAAQQFADLTQDTTLDPAERRQAAEALTALN